MADRILLAEGNVSLADADATELFRKGYTVDVLHDGEEALEYLRTQTEAPVAVVLEASLPKKNGFTVIEEMRTELGGASIPVIILSTLGDAHDLDRCTALGTEGCLIRTQFSSADIATEIHRIVSGEMEPLETGSVPKEEPLQQAESAPAPQASDPLLDTTT